MNVVGRPRGVKGAHEDPHPSDVFKGYQLDGFNLVPHYTEEGYFVLPKGQVVSEERLRALGATPIEMVLWESPGRKL